MPILQPCKIRNPTRNSNSELSLAFRFFLIRFPIQPYTINLREDSRIDFRLQDRLHNLWTFHFHISATLTQFLLNRSDSLKRLQVVMVNRKTHRLTFKVPRDLLYLCPVTPNNTFKAHPSFQLGTTIICLLTFQKERIRHYFFPQPEFSHCNIMTAFLRCLECFLFPSLWLYKK